MGRGIQTEHAVRNIIRLRSMTHSLTGADDASSLLAEILEDLRADAGETVPKASAARILGISTNTLNKWVGRGLIPVRTARAKEEVVRSALEELAEEVRFVRHGDSSRSDVIAFALKLLAARRAGGATLEDGSVSDDVTLRELRDDAGDLTPGERVAQAAELSEVLTGIEMVARPR